MKIADTIVNALFNRNRKDLLNDLNLNLIKDYRRVTVIRSAIELTSKGEDLSKENFLNWHHAEKFKNDDILNYFKYATREDVPLPPQVHEQLKHEHDNNRIFEFIKKVNEKDSTHEIKIDSIIGLYKQVIQNTEVKRVHSLRTMREELIDKLEAKEKDEYLERSIEIGFKDMAELMGGRYIHPRPHVILGLPGRYKTSILINIMAYMMRTHKKKGLYFSLEDSRHVLLKKWLAVELDVFKDKLIQGKLDNIEKDRLKKIYNDNLHIVDNGCTVADISTIIESQMAKEPFVSERRERGV
jgi:hypothetical protein